MSGLSLLVLAFALPETSRNIVGNGSLRPKRFLNTSYLVWVKFRSRPLPSASVTQGENPKLRLPSLMPCFKAVFQAENALLMLINGLVYMTYCCVQASLSSLFITKYGFKEVYAGLVYVPFGLGCALASYTCGKMMNRTGQVCVLTREGHIMNMEYRRAARNADFTIDRVRGDDLAEFPIENARLRITHVYVALAVATIVAYGWTVDKTVVCGYSASP